jgi:hypothetical protein
MARRRTPTPLEAWMGTPDEVDFCSPYTSCEAYMLFMKRDREREHLEAFALVRGKNLRGKNGDLRFLPFTCFIFFFFFP